MPKRTMMLAALLVTILIASTPALAQETTGAAPAQQTGPETTRSVAESTSGPGSPDPSPVLTPSIQSAASAAQDAAKNAHQFIGLDNNDVKDAYAKALGAAWPTADSTGISTPPAESSFQEAEPGTTPAESGLQEAKSEAGEVTADNDDASGADLQHHGSVRSNFDEVGHHSNTSPKDAAATAGNAAGSGEEIVGDDTPGEEETSSVTQDGDGVKSRDKMVAAMPTKSNAPALETPANSGDSVPVDAKPTSGDAPLFLGGGGTLLLVGGFVAGKAIWWRSRPLIRRGRIFRP